MAIPRIEYYNHLINLKVKKCVDVGENVKSVIDSVHLTMSEFLSKFRDQTIFNVELVVHNETRWSRLYSMLNRCSRLRDDFVAVSKQKVHSSVHFRNMIKRVGKMLGKCDKN